MKDKIRPFVNFRSDKLSSFFRFPILILKIISGYISKMVSHSRKSLSALDHGNEAERICWPANGSENSHPSPIINTVAVTAFLAGTICLPINAILAHSTNFPVLALNIRLAF